MLDLKQTINYRIVYSYCHGVLIIVSSHTVSYVN